jgi:hypothetical protein
VAWAKSFDKGRPTVTDRLRALAFLEAANRLAAMYSDDDLAVEHLRQWAGETHAEEPSAEELAGHLAAQRMSVLQGAFRILGWPPLEFEVAADEQPATGRPDRD